MSGKKAPPMRLGNVLPGSELKNWGGNGQWIEVDADGHGGAALVVWRMEDEERSPLLETRARRVVAAFNACAGVPVEVLEANASGGLPWLVADQIDARVERDALVTALRAAQQAINSMKDEAETGAVIGDVIGMADALEEISRQGLEADTAIRAALVKFEGGTR